MENSYGIGIANRYELFLVDEEAGTPTNKAIKKAKQQKKSTASANVAANGAATVEKENKPANSNKASNPASSKPQQQQQQHQQHQQQQQQQHQQQQQSATGKSVKTNQNGQQNIRSDRPPRDGKDNKNQDRKTDGNIQNGENREQRYNRNINRKPRENQQLINADGTTGNPNRIGGRNLNNERNVNNERNYNFSERNERGPQNRRSYGKREFDRQSGSDKTGVKAVDKRDGAGAHNWGSHKQDVDDYNKGNVATADWDAERDGQKIVKDDKANNGETKPTDEQNGKDGIVTEPASVEEETKEITLDEWKAQRAERAKPQYNIRKAGEGEDTSQWKKMVALDNRKKKSDESDEEYEYDPSMYPQRVGRQKFLDIDIHFNDGPRGNVNRRRGRQRGGPRQWTGPNAEGQEIEQNITTQTTGPIPPTTNNTNANANANANAAANNAPVNVNANPIITTTNANNASSTNNTNNNRRRNNQSYRNRQDRGRFDDRRQNAPKVDDENDFPSLG